MTVSRVQAAQLVDFTFASPSIIQINGFIEIKQPRSLELSQLHSSRKKKPVRSMNRAACWVNPLLFALLVAASYVPVSLISSSLYKQKHVVTVDQTVFHKVDKELQARPTSSQIL